ncbi:MAG: hypothetical protein ABR927_08445 [Bacteroidales bacterium]|jgi:hypothetical protein
MKKLNFILIFLAVLAFSCSKDGMLNTDPVADKLSGNTALMKCGNVVKVYPGPNDTQDLIDAFAQAQVCGKNAVVKLMPGTFSIGMIEVRAFNGTFCGSGMGKTIITNLPGLTPESNTLQNKLPALITFIGGNVTVSDLSVTQTETLSLLGNEEMNLLLFSDYSADYVPTRQYIGVTLNNIEVTGLQQSDVTMWDGTVADYYPYYNYNGVKLAPDVYEPVGSTLITRGNIDADVSNSRFNNFWRGLYVFGCKSGNLSFGMQGSNVFSGNYQGLLVNQNIGVKVKMMHNVFNVTAYNYDGIDVNCSEEHNIFEYVREEAGNYEISNNVFNLHYGASGIGMWDGWRYAHPDNPVWIQMFCSNNTFNDMEDWAWPIQTYAMKNGVFTNNTITGDASLPDCYWFIAGDEWYVTSADDPNYLLSVGENCKMVNNNFQQKNFIVVLYWDTQNNLVEGDLSNVTLTDLGVNNKVIGVKNPGHGIPKECMDRIGRMHNDMFNRHNLQ